MKEHTYKRIVVTGHLVAAVLSGLNAGLCFSADAFRPGMVWVSLAGIWVVTLLLRFQYEKALASGKKG